MLITFLDVALVLWLSRAFLANCFINSFYAHAMFKRRRMTQSICNFFWWSELSIGISYPGVNNSKTKNSLLIDSKCVLKHNFASIIYIIYIRKLFSIFALRERQVQEFGLCFLPILISLVTFQRVQFLLRKTSFVFSHLQTFFFFEPLKRYFLSRILLGTNISD